MLTILRNINRFGTFPNVQHSRKCWTREEVFTRESKDFVKLQFAGDTVVCTPEHPFFVGGHWVDAGNLKTAIRILR